MGQEKKQCVEKMDLNANVRVVPDGGWGWIISFAAFTVQFIILGLQNHLGLIHREHMSHFGESSLKTGIFSLLIIFIIVVVHAYDRAIISNTQIYFIILKPIK